MVCSVCFVPGVGRGGPKGPGPAAGQAPIFGRFAGRINHIIHQMTRRLGIGFVGSGFITRFHIQSMVGVRGADVRGVWSPNETSRWVLAAFHSTNRQLALCR